jgi:hypothetical protein
MVRLLFAVLKLGVEYTHTLVGQYVVYMSAISTIIGQLGIVTGIEPDVIHVLALFAEFHGG